jgi:hypothetical protein
MKRLLLVITLLLLAAPAVASSTAPQPGLADIVLGTPSTPAAQADPAQVKAVERFLAARQEGSIHRKRQDEARRLMAMKARPSEETLFGPRGATITAYDFENESIEAFDRTHFQVPVYTILANPDGQVVSSRTEMLTFVRNDGGWLCSDLHPIDSIQWWPAALSDAAKSLGAGEEYMRAQSFLREARSQDRQALAYSLADIQRTDDRVVVQCLRFASDVGKRGFEINDTPIVLSRSADGLIRIESN